MQVAVLALVQSRQRRIAAPEPRLGQDSSHSSKPPLQRPAALEAPPAPVPLGHAAWRAAGHQRHTRTSVPPEPLTAIIACQPAAYRRWGHDLQGADPEPVRHQVAELSEVRPHVVAHRLHRPVCPRCGASARGGLPAGVPRGAFRPRLQADVGLKPGPTG